MQNASAVYFGTKQRVIDIGPIIPRSVAPFTNMVICLKRGQL